MAILFLFGAGASFGSEPRELPKPPLGDDLFDKLVELGGVASDLPVEAKDVFYESGFETGMAALALNHENKIESFNREMCQFLGQFTPSANSNYISLLKKLVGRNIVFSSLNYDMMLEGAAESIGCRTKYDIERDHGSIRLIKPHGSINFLPDLMGNDFSGLVGIGCKVALDCAVVPVSREECLARTGKKGSFSPAISLYAKGKPVRVSPAFVKAQQEYFEISCRRASKIFIIGVRLVAEDDHIWGPLKRSGADVTYFGSEGEQKALRAWASTGTTTNLNYVVGYFDKAVEVIDDYL